MATQPAKELGASGSPDLLIGPGLVFSAGGLLAGAGLSVRDGRIVEVGRYGALETACGPEVPRLDARGGLILPGLINAHTHLYSSLARGMRPAGAPAEDFLQILERLWWRLDSALTPEDVRVSALVGLVEAVRCGVTTVIDHHSSPGACADSLDVIRAAAEEAGVRAGLCYEVSDRHGAAAARAGIEENLRFARELRRAPARGVSAQFGVHALFTVGDETLEACAGAARAEGLPLHLHAAEDRADVRLNLERYDERPIQRLARHQALTPETLVAHCVHVDGHEIEMLARSGSCVVHNPESNMNNAVGAAPVRALLSGGARVGLGTDGMHADMLASARAAFLLHHHAEGDPRGGWEEGPRMLWGNNAALATALFRAPIGELAAGGEADLIVLDYDPPTPLTGENLFAHLIFGLGARHVASTVAAGRVLMRDRRVLTVDCSALQARAREQARALWERVAAAGGR